MPYTVRAPRHEDTKQLLDVIHAHDIAEYGEPDFEEQDILDDWSRPGFDVERDAWMAVTDEGRVVGYANLFRDRADAIVHPDYAKRIPLWNDLLKRMEQRRLELAGPETPVVIKHWCNGRNPEHRDFFLNNGYECERTFYRMLVDFDDMPAAPVLPEGVTIRSFVQGQDDAEYHSVFQRGFAQHYGFKPSPLEELMIQTTQAGYHPDLWAIAEEDGRMIGIVGAREATGFNFVRRLCTLPEARGRGIGLALLQHAFRVGYERGFKRACLGVDSDNATGALQLYHRAGMQVEMEHHCFAKSLL